MQQNVYPLASFNININYLTLHLVYICLLYIKCFWFLHIFGLVGQARRGNRKKL